MDKSDPLPRKVLMTADATGGVWVYALELARGLAERGVEVALASMGAPLDEAQREKAERIARLKLFESTFKLEWMELPWRDLERAGAWLLGLEERIGPDLIHLNSFAHGALPFHAPKLVVGHSDVLCWWSAVKGEPAPAEWDRYRREVAAGLAAADMLATPTAAMLSALQQHYGELPPARVIPNCGDSRLFRPAAKEPLVFAAGSLWDETDGLTALEPAALRLPWPVYVAGETRHPDAATAPLVPTPHTRLLGKLSQRALAAWLGRSSIYALPARYQPSGQAVVEAALAGCALVLGDIPSLRELWDGRAVFVAPGDPAALERALRELIADPARRGAFSTAARLRALELTPERTTNGYLAAYQELVAASGVRPVSLAARILNLLGSEAPAGGATAQT